MSSIAKVAEYCKAIHITSGKRIAQYPASAYSILLSRLRYGIGPRLHALFGLRNQPRDKWQDYLLDEENRIILRRINPPDRREVVNDKLAFFGHCLEHGIETIPIVCAVDNMRAAGPTSPFIISSVQEWEKRLQSYQQPLFIKQIDGSWGQDAFAAQPSGRGWSYCGRRGNSEEFFAFTSQRFAGQRGWLVQPRISSHPDLQRISAPGALSTIRVITCINDANLRLLYATLRIPVGNNATDSFVHGSTGNLIAPIDLVTGELGPCQGSMNKNWPEIIDVPVHPDTGNQIQHTHVPLWQDVLDLIERGQRSLPGLRTLGWDIAVTDKGPLVVEANATYDVDLIQVSHQCGVGNVLKPWLEKNDV